MSEEKTQPGPIAAEPQGVSDVRPSVELRGVTKRFGDVVAVRDLDLEIAAGEFFTLLGPSGRGKSTTLRCRRDPASTW